MTDLPQFVVGRALAIEAKRAARLARLEDAEELITRGGTAAGVAMRLGTTPEGLYALLRRTGRLDLWRQARRSEGATGIRGDQRLNLALPSSRV